jgi:hypothetical protein
MPDLNVLRIKILFLMYLDYFNTLMLRINFKKYFFNIFIFKKYFLKKIITLIICTLLFDIEKENEEIIERASCPN